MKCEKMDWTVDIHPIGCISDNKGRRIARVIRDVDNQSIDEFKLNQELIVFAPKMLNILRSMCSKIRASGNSKCCRFEIAQAESISRLIADCESDEEEDSHE